MKKFTFKERQELKHGKKIVVCSSNEEKELLTKRFPKGTTIAVKADTGDRGSYRIISLDDMAEAAKIRAIKLGLSESQKEMSLEEHKRLIRFMQECEMEDTVYADELRGSDLLS